jgi:hypothetical protein
VVLLFLILANGSQALVSTRHSCRILISLEKVNGEEQNIQFSSGLKTKEQCKALAHIHRNNFDPDKIKKKKVTFFWKKNIKSIPSLAKRTRKTRSKKF